MVQGVEVDLFRPDDELRRLAKLAVELDVADALATGDVDEALAAVAAAPRGDRVARRLGGREGSVVQLLVGQRLLQQRPGLARPPRDPARLPARLRRAGCEAGEEIDRPTAAIAAERDRITAEYRALLADDEVRAAFDEKLGLSRLVFPYVENHNFYVEHWALSVFWRKIRELGAGARGRRLLARRPTTSSTCAATSCQQVLYDYGNGWGVGADTIGPYALARPRSSAGEAIIAALETKAPPPAMNEPPEVVTEPFTIMLYGHHDGEREQVALRVGEATDELRGMAASPGTRRGHRAGRRRRRPSSTSCRRARSSSPGSRRRAGGRSSAGSARSSPTSAG